MDVSPTNRLHGALILVGCWRLIPDGSRHRYLIAARRRGDWSGALAGRRYFRRRYDGGRSDVERGVEVAVLVDHVVASGDHRLAPYLATSESNPPGKPGRRAGRTGPGGLPEGDDLREFAVDLLTRPEL